MKVRNGFVSNSSSSSFVILGTSDDQVCKRLGEKLGFAFDDCDDCDDIDYDDVYEIMDKFSGSLYGSVRLPDDKDVEIVIDTYDREVRCAGILLSNDGEEIDLPDDTKPLKEYAAERLSKASCIDNISPSSIKLICGESSNEA